MEISEETKNKPKFQKRKPGEFIFAIIICLFSAALLWNAYGISNFDALSAPGTIPMTATFIMLATSIIIAFQAYRKNINTDQKFFTEVLSKRAIFFMLMIIAYAIVLRPLGFLPTSAIFLVATIKVLSNRGWGFSIGISLFVLIIVWLIFRVVFTVLTPPGIIPESEILQMFRNFFGGIK